MYPLKLFYRNQRNNKKDIILLENRGFTLIELPMGICIIGIIILSLYFMFNYSVKVTQIGEEKEEILLNGRYAIEYIKKEIRQSEEIISTSKFGGFNEKFKENFGFVLKINKDNESKYVSYYFKNGSIYRIVSTNTNTKYPYAGSFQGHNKIVENIISIEGSKANFQNDKIVLNLLMGGKWNKNIELKTEVFMRCPTDY